MNALGAGSADATVAWQIQILQAALAAFGAPFSRTPSVGVVELNDLLLDTAGPDSASLLPGWRQR